MYIVWNARAAGFATDEEKRQNQRACMETNVVFGIFKDNSRSRSHVIRSRNISMVHKCSPRIVATGVGDGTWSSFARAIASRRPCLQSGESRGE